MIASKKKVVFSLFIFFVLAVSAVADVKYSNAKYNCSFTLKGEKWQKNSGPFISLIGSGLIEYINLKNYSYLTFVAENTDIGVLKTVGTTLSILKGRSKVFSIIRQEGYRVGGAIGRWGHFLFVTHSGSGQVGFYIVLRQKGINYQFIMSGDEIKSAVIKRKLFEVLSSFKVKKSQKNK